jgi:hypothetical protein
VTTSIWTEPGHRHDSYQNMHTRVAANWSNNVEGVGIDSDIESDSTMQGCGHGAAGFDAEVARLVYRCHVEGWGRVKRYS